MPVLATVWPVRGSSASEGLLVLVFCLVLLSAAPFAWAFVRRAFGQQAAGPLWPILLFVALAAAYAVATPPWQTPDEPQHMVHVEVVRRAGWSSPAQLVPGGHATASASAAQRAADADVVASMRESDAGRWLPGGAAGLAAGAVPGPRELSNPRLYYAVSAALTKPLGGAGILGRLAVVRSLGVLLGAVTVWTCGAAGRLLWPGRKMAEAPLALAVAIPTFVAFAGSANNDAMAAALAAVLLTVLLAGVLESGRLARPVPWAITITAVTVAGVSTKRTFLSLVLLVLIAVLIRLRRRAALVVACLVVTVLAVAGLFSLSWSPRLALWDQQTSAVSYRCRDPQTREWSICIPPQAPSVEQKLPLERVQHLRGEPVLLTLSVRSTAPNDVLVLDISARDRTTVRIGAGLQRTPATVDAVVPTDADSVTLDLSGSGKGTLLVRDAMLRADPGGGLSQRNELRNGSGELAVAGAPSFLPDSLRRQVDSALDSVNRVARSGGALVASVPILYRRMATTFSMFWGTAGWQVPPPLFPAPVNWVLAVLVVVTVGGAAVALLRTRLPAFAGGLLLFSATVVTLAVVFRNLPPDEAGVVNGRYLFPGLVAFVAILAAGGGHLFPGREAHFRTATRCAVPVLHGLFLALVFIPWLTR